MSVRSCHCLCLKRLSVCGACDPWVAGGAPGRGRQRTLRLESIASAGREHPAHVPQSYEFQACILSDVSNLLTSERMPATFVHYYVV